MSAFAGMTKIGFFRLFTKPSKLKISGLLFKSPNCPPAGPGSGNARRPGRGSRNPDDLGQAVQRCLFPPVPLSIPLVSRPSTFYLLPSTWFTLSFLKLHPYGRQFKTQQGPEFVNYKTLVGKMDHSRPVDKQHERGGARTDLRRVHELQPPPVPSRAEGAFPSPAG